MALSAAAQSECPKVIYLVERRSLPPPSNADSFLERTKYIAGVAIALIGLSLLAFASFSLIGKILGLWPTLAVNIEMLFMSGLVSAVAGFNLAGKGAQPAEIYLGPLSVTV